MNYQILFTDLDGTLLTSQKNISKNTQDAIHTMLQNNKKLVLASGRPLYSILERKNALGIPDHNVYITAFNGSLLYDCEQEKLLAKYPVSPKVAQKIFDLALEENLHIHTFQDKTVISSRDDAELQYYVTFVKSEVIISSDLSTFEDKDLYKLLAIDLNESETNRLHMFKDKISSLTPSLPIQSAFSHPTYLEFFSEESGKGQGLLHLCKLLNIPVSASIAVGDEENDLSMITAAGLGVSMQNGSDLLKSNADYVTEHDNDHDGIAEIIQKFM